MILGTVYFELRDRISTFEERIFKPAVYFKPRTIYFSPRTVYFTGEPKYWFYLGEIVFHQDNSDFTKSQPISPRSNQFHQDIFDFTKIFSISPRVHPFHQVRISPRFSPRWVDPQGKSIYSLYSINMIKHHFCLLILFPEKMMALYLLFLRMI